MTTAEWWAIGGTTVLAAIVQATFASAAGWTRPMGDEIEYLERAAADDPTAPQLFVRVPGFIWFVRALHGHERRTRLLQHVVAVATVAVAASAAARVGGAEVAWVCGVTLALLPDRWVLAGRIWPDVPLALHHAIVLALLTVADRGTGVSPWWFGVVAASAVVVRIDALVLPVVLAVLPLARGGQAAWSGVLGILVPTVVALVLLALRNRRRYGLFAVDTTLAFNLRVMAREQRDPATTVQVAVDDVLGDWSPASPQGALRRAFGGVGTPARMVVGIGHRLVSMAGADTFARERLLPASGGWPDMPSAVRRPVAAVLRISTPALIGAAACGVAAGSDVTLQLLWPVVAAYVAMCAVHARTRFRAVLFPWLALWAGVGAVHVWRTPTVMPVAIGVAVAVAAALVPPRRESQ
ncbi:MAG: hypothetical protein RL238_194 [Actinomycetota bacterium]|jgi:hypothetical protein